MKKISIVSMILAVCLATFAFITPANAWTLKFNTFKHTYQGTWTNTKSECFTPGNTGTITIQLKSLKKVNKYNAKVTSAQVWFSDGTYGGMKAKGKITVSKSGKIKKLRLDYGAEENGVYYLTGTITGKKLTGHYYHTGGSGNYYEGCSWSGKFSLNVK
jgi:hypothetical protein